MEFNSYNIRPNFTFKKETIQYKSVLLYIPELLLTAIYLIINAKST
jgi:hypothetical protein